MEKLFLGKLFFLLFMFFAAFANCDSAKSPVLILADFEANSLANNLGGAGTTMGNGNGINCCKALTVPSLTIPNSKHCLRFEYQFKDNIPDLCGFITDLKDSDLSGYDHLEFFVKGDAALGFTTVFQVEFTKWADPKALTGKIYAHYRVDGITDSWQKVVIPLNKFTGFSSDDRTKEWNSVSSFNFIFKANMVDKQKGAIYVDDIVLTKTTDSGPHIYDKQKRKRMKSFTEDTPDWKKFEVLKKRLEGFPSTVVVPTFAIADDKLLLQKIAKDTWGYFANFVDIENGLPLDAILVSDNANTLKDPVIGDYVNITDIGVYLMCIVGALELGFIDRQEALERTSDVIHALEKLEKYEGYFYNYYDTTTLERTSSLVSSVDSGWLLAGLYVVKGCFSENKKLVRLVDNLMAFYDFKFLYDFDANQLTHGFNTIIGEKAAYNYGVLYTESRVASYIAIAREDVPLKHWFALKRGFSPKDTWQTNRPLRYTKNEVLGHTYDLGIYAYEGIEYIPSWGGSLFEALMPTMVLNEAKLAPLGLGMNNSRHVQVQIKYARQLGYPVWGMSPCTTPQGGYSEYGAKPLSISAYRNGVVTPHVTFLSLEYAPQEAISNLRTLLKLYPNLYGEYGFYDSVDVMTGEVPYKYLCLDQGMSFIGIVNYLTNGKIRDYFNQDPIFKKCEKLLTQEVIFKK